MALCCGRMITGAATRKRRSSGHQYLPPTTWNRPLWRPCRQTEHPTPPLSAARMARRAWQWSRFTSCTSLPGNVALAGCLFRKEEAAQRCDWAPGSKRRSRRVRRPDRASHPGGGSVLVQRVNFHECHAGRSINAADNGRVRRAVGRECRHDGGVQGIARRYPSRDDIR